MRRPSGPELLALLLTGFVVVLVQSHGGSVVATVAATAMTLPVAWADRRPESAALALAVATAGNELLAGHLIRCGATLPAAFAVAFLGARALGTASPWLVGGVSAALVWQCLDDPRLGAGTVALMLPVAGAFGLGGHYLHRRDGLVSDLRTRTRRLQEQRDETARLAVLADREQVTRQLGSTLGLRISVIERLSDTCGGHEQLAEIEQLGRQTLEEMRQLLGSLREAPTAPEPGIAELPLVCARATTSRVLLTVDGEPRPLPASIELAVCRITEQLIRLLADDPGVSLQLRVDHQVSSLELVVSGPPAPEADLQHVGALARARAVLHGGTIDLNDAVGTRRATVRLPLVSARG